MKPRGQLMIEHRLIEKLLAEARKQVERMDSGHFDPILIDTIVDFIVTYADRTHHGKEEDILFRGLSSKTLAGEERAQMDDLIEEHRQARARVSQIAELNEKFKAGDRGVVPEIKAVILWLADFYPGHIRKEDKEFFPRTEKRFTDKELSAMLEEFWTFDRGMIHEKYRNILDALSGGKG